MINTEVILEAVMPSMIKGIIAIVIIATFQILFLRFLKKMKQKKYKKKDSKYVNELKTTINKLTNENKKLKNRKPY